MPQDRKTPAGIEQTGDTRAKVPLACFIQTHSGGNKNYASILHITM